MSVVGDECPNNISMILELLESLNLVFKLKDRFVVAHLDGLSARFKQMQQLFVVENKVDPGD